MTQRINLNLKWLVAVILAIVGTLAALPYLSSREADATMQTLGEAAARERAYDQLLGYLTDAETGQRGFVITGDKSFLENYHAGVAGIPGVLHTLRGNALADDGERAAVAQIASLTERKLAELDETIELRRAQGYEAAARVVADLRGKRDMDSLRSLIGQRIDQLGAERLALRARMRTTLGYNTALGIAASLVSALVACVALYVAGRNLRERALAAEQARASADAAAHHALLAETRNARLEVTAQMLQALDSLVANAELPAILPVFLARLLPATSGAVYLYRSSRDFLQRAAAWGEAGALEELIDPAACWGLRFGAPHLAEGAGSLRCPHCLDAQAGDDDGAQQLCVPMVSQGEVIGLLVVQRRAGGDAAIEKTVAVAAAEQLSLGISNINLREMLRRQSTVDALTGLYNRRYFDESFKREIFRAERKQTPFALVMVDLDHFKRMNDTHGHDAGDLVLQAAARCLQDGIRRSDLACRYGGEEMALLLVECDAASARRCAEAIRAAIAALALEHRGVRLPGVTASFGVAAWPEHGASPDDLLKAADRALYASKHGGRDRVTLA
jgi:diguanylate cyclase (GGDEF)-like protein